MPKTKGQHGGRRKGAGRKPRSDPLALYSVRISRAQVKLLRAWGGGDLSAGIRWLIDAAAPVVKRT